jgi:MerR family transcriptional regulator, light-induced transcriptional regulator
MTQDGRKYRINVVATMTGVSAATLRAWERRYGLPAPRRTPSSYRMYSTHDVESIRRMRTLCDEGLMPSEAARVVAEEMSRTEAAVNVTDPFTTSRDAILAAVENFDPIALESSVQHAVALGSAATIYDRVLRPVMVEIGDRWHRGSLTIGQEHLATQVIETATRRLLALVQPNPPAREVVLAGFAGDEHVLPLHGVALHLAGAGFRTVILGARTPPGALRHAVEEIEPVCVGLSVTIAPPSHEARTLVDGYAAACGSTPWIVGGLAAEALRPWIEHRGGTVLPRADSPTIVRAVEAASARRGERNEAVGG